MRTTDHRPLGDSHPLPSQFGLHNFWPHKDTILHLVELLAGIVPVLFSTSLLQLSFEYPSDLKADLRIHPESNGATVRDQA
jgi:hypothetical protein